jgi:RimJ/RimL family protein N-acetyltransferase
MPRIQHIINSGSFGTEIVIETDRTVIRSVIESDKPLYQVLFADPNVMAKYATGQPKVSIEEQAAVVKRVQLWIERWQTTPSEANNKNYDPYNGMAVFEKATGEFIGHVVIGRSDIEAQEDAAISEVAYLFHKKYWRDDASGVEGFGREIIQATMDLIPELAATYLLDGKRLTALVATTRTDHIASQKILERTGFTTDKTKVNEKFGATRYLYTKLISAPNRSEMKIPCVAPSVLGIFRQKSVVGHGEYRAVTMRT